MNTPFSWPRAFAILMKEFIQMRRDRATFAMMVGVPVMQILLFGYAINMDPKHLPTALHVADAGVYARSIEAALKNSDYFDIVRVARTPAEASALLDRGDVAFSITIPSDFTRKLVRGERPQILIEADASDPSAASNALATMATLGTTALAHDLVGPLAARAGAPPFDTVIQRRYNPEGITAYNIVPGLLGVILTMTMVMITSVAVTRERERGTMENLLAMPVRPLEVMIGKIVPFFLIGFVQVSLVLLIARWVFGVPMLGSIALLYAAVGIFIAANLAVGFTFSTFAKTQLQAMQMAVFFSAAVDSAVGFRLSVPRHAGMGAMDRLSTAQHTFSACGPGHPVEGERPAGNLAASVADTYFLSCCRHDGANPLSPHPRLGQIAKKRLAPI